MTRKTSQRWLNTAVQWGLTALLLAFSAFSSAHQMKAAITTVLFNPRTENIEIMHRFNLHDAEHAVKALFDKKADIHNNADTQYQFANYVAERFHLLSADDSVLPLAMIGFETEGKHFWVYQETARPPELRGLTIQHDALRDLWPDQVNTLNVEGNGPIETLTFTENVSLLEVTFNGS